MSVENTSRSPSSAICEADMNIRAMCGKRGGKKWVSLTGSSYDSLVRDDLSFVGDRVALAGELPDDVHDVRSRHLQRRERRFHRRRGVDFRRLRRWRHRLVVADKEDFDSMSNFAIWKSK